MSLVMRGPPRLDLRARASALATTSTPTTKPAAGKRAGKREKGRAKGARAAARIKRWMARDAARRNVEQGRAHPALYKLWRRAMAYFKPHKDIVPKRMRNRRKEYWRSYFAAAAAYNRMGQPLPGGRGWWKPNGRPRQPRVIAGNIALGKAMTNAATEMSTTVCVMAKAGEVPRIVAVERSPIKVLDRLARAAMQRAIRLQTMPTDIDNSRACYRFSVFFGTRLIKPGVMCTFRSLFGGWRCNKPEIFHHRTRLSRVSYPRGYGFFGRKARRRRLRQQREREARRAAKP